MSNHPYKIQVQSGDTAEKDPRKKVFYQVLLRYNTDAEENSDIQPEAKMMESHPCANVEEAHEVLSSVLDDIIEKIPESEIVKIPKKDQIDNFNLLVIRKRETKESELFILARLGIIMIDYTTESIH